MIIEQLFGSISVPDQNTAYYAGLGNILVTTQIPQGGVESISDARSWWKEDFKCLGVNDIRTGKDARMTIKGCIALDSSIPEWIEFFRI